MTRFAHALQNIVYNLRILHKFTKHPPNHPKKSHKPCVSSTERFFHCTRRHGLGSGTWSAQYSMNSPLQLEIDASIFQTYTTDMIQPSHASKIHLPSTYMTYSTYSHSTTKTYNWRAKAIMNANYIGIEHNQTQKINMYRQVGIKHYHTSNHKVQQHM